jgi:hypothetical protein
MMANSSVTVRRTQQNAERMHSEKFAVSRERVPPKNVHGFRVGSSSTEITYVGGDVTFSGEYDFLAVSICRHCFDVTLPFERFLAWLTLQQSDSWPQ